VFFLKEDEKMLLRISFVVAMVCVWCVIGETMPKVISNHLNKKNETKAQPKLDLNIENRARLTRQLDPNDWVPFQPPVPAMWNPRPRSPLYTWWGAPWPYDGAGAMIRVRPPGAYLPPLEEIDHEIHAHHKHHDHHHHHHNKPLYHDYHQRPVPPPFPPQAPFPPQSPFFPGIQGTYIAQNPGAIHIAPLLGHAESVIASNLQAAPGTITIPAGPFPAGTAGSIAIDGPIPPRPIRSPPVPPAPIPTPLARTW